MSPKNTIAIQNELLELITAGERDSATELISQWAEKRNYEDAILEILDPVLSEFGKSWGDSDQVSLGQGYVLSKVAEDIFKFAAAERQLNVEVVVEKGPIVIGNILDDSHGLGRKLVITFLQLEGWKLYDLGNDVSPEEFIDKALEVGAPIIAVSAMMLRTAMNIKTVRKELDERGLADKIKLAVGGAVFCQRPELITEVGGDGTVTNAVKAPALMEKLLQQIKQ